MEERFAVAAFRSRQQVMQLQSVLRHMGIASSIVTTPRSIAVGCGLSVRFAPENVQAVADALRAPQQGNLIGFYLVTRDEHGRISCERLGTQPGMHGG